MKKFSILLIYTFCISLFVVGCSNNNTSTLENTEIVIDTTETLTVPPAKETVEPPTEEPYTSTDPLWLDEHPAEGTTRSSLTNMWVTNEVQAIRPITVMFPTDQIAQPQYNIGEAGILYEIMAEGGISRMMGVIQGWHTMDKIGNIRSMREYFVYAAKEWNAIMIHHGNIWYADEILNSVDHIDGTQGESSLAFYRVADKDAPHNSFVSGEGILDYIEYAGFSLVHTSGDYTNHFIFTPMSVQNTFKDYSVVYDATFIDMSPSFSIDSPYFEYNEEDGLYYRFMYGNKHIDAATGKQLSFKNIIVQNAYWETKPDGEYLTFLMHDTARDGWFFTNGKAIHITWEKTLDESPTKYYDDNGAEIVLNTGKTMIFVNQEDKNFIFE